MCLWSGWLWGPLRLSTELQSGLSPSELAAPRFSLSLSLCLSLSLSLSLSISLSLSLLLLWG